MPGWKVTGGDSRGQNPGSQGEQDGGPELETQGSERLAQREARNSGIP